MATGRGEQSYFSDSKEKRWARLQHIRTMLIKFEHRVQELQGVYADLVVIGQQDNSKGKNYLNQAKGIQGTAMGFVETMNQYLDEVGANKHHYTLKQLWPDTSLFKGIKPTHVKGTVQVGPFHFTAAGRKAEKKSRERVERLTKGPSIPDIVDKMRTHEEKTGIDLREPTESKKKRTEYNVPNKAPPGVAVGILRKKAGAQFAVAKILFRDATKWKHTGNKTRAGEALRHAREQMKTVRETLAEAQRHEKKASGKGGPAPALPAKGKPAPKKPLPPRKRRHR